MHPLLDSIGMSGVPGVRNRLSCVAGCSSSSPSLRLGLLSGNGIAHGVAYPILEMLVLFDLVLWLLVASYTKSSVSGSFGHFNPLVVLDLEFVT